MPYATPGADITPIIDAPPTPIPYPVAPPGRRGQQAPVSLSGRG